MIFTQVLKYRVRYGPEPKLHFENEFERSLNEAVADEKFEATLQCTAIRRQKTTEQPEHLTPDHADFRIAPRRDRAIWQPQLPGVLHQDHIDF